MTGSLLHTALVVLHIVLVTVWFGLSLRLQFQAKALTTAATGAAESIRTNGDRTVQLMSVAIIVFYALAVANFFVGGGFAVYGANYHASLTLGLGLVLAQVLVVQPAWGRLSGGQPAQARRVAMGIGVGHGLWLVILVLMFYPYGGLRRTPDGAVTAPAAPAVAAPAATR